MDFQLSKNGIMSTQTFFQIFWSLSPSCPYWLICQSMHFEFLPTEYHKNCVWRTAVHVLCICFSPFLLFHLKLQLNHASRPVPGSLETKVRQSLLNPHLMSSCFCFIPVMEKGPWICSGLMLGQLVLLLELTICRCYWELGYSECRCCFCAWPGAGRSLGQASLAQSESVWLWMKLLFVSCGSVMIFLLAFLSITIIQTLCLCYCNYLTFLK